MRRNRAAKIVSTLGPASSTPEKIAELFEAGADVFRLNFSHGTHEDHAERYRAIRELEEKFNRPVGVLSDLQGPKIRVDTFAGGAVELNEDDEFFLDGVRDVPGDDKRVSISNPEIFPSIKTGAELLLNDGKIRLVVKQNHGSSVSTVVQNGGELSDHKGLNLPGTVLPMSAMTDKDLKDLEFALDLGTDWVGLSFVQRPEDVMEAKKIIRGRASVLAKLEKPHAIQHLKSIVEIADAVMVARGDLGVEAPPEDVPGLQKQIIRQARSEGKPVIVATQMLESMVTNPRPTRAEASDVANAIFDGTDAVMLSAETTKGRYPVESVVMMARIIDEAEKAGSRTRAGRPHKAEDISIPEAVCNAAFHASKSINAQAIVVFTQTGSTARMISKFRPSANIFGLTPHSRVMNRMALYWGVQPLQMPEIANLEQLIEELEKLLLKIKLVSAGDKLIILTGGTIVQEGSTTLMKLHEVKPLTPDP